MYFTVEFIYCFISEMKKRDYLRRSILTRQNGDFGDVMAKSLKFGISRNTKKFLEEAQTNILLNREWKEYAK